MVSLALALVTAACGTLPAPTDESTPRSSPQNTITFVWREYAGGWEVCGAIDYFYVTSKVPNEERYELWRYYTIQELEQMYALGPPEKSTMVPHCSRDNITWWYRAPDPK